MTLTEGDRIYGLRDVGAYKVYSKGSAYFASHKDDVRLRRIQIARAQAELLAKKSKSDFAAEITLRLDVGKRSGLPSYFEVRHG